MTSPERLSASARSIFVAIPSYCDSECAHTIADLYSQAGRPERVSVGICWQYKPGTMPDRCPSPSCPAGQIRQVAFPAAESRGAGWARSNAIGLHAGEEYVLLIDSHMRFEPRWDEILIRMLHECPTRRAVLTALLPNYEDRFLCLAEQHSIFRIAVTGLSDMSSPHVVHLGGIVSDSRTLDRPLPSAGIVFNCVFARRAAFTAVPVDPHVFFYGDEIAHAARLWTNGYDMYQPYRRVAYHRWTPAGSYKVANGALSERSRQRVLHLLRLAEATDPEAVRDLDRFGLGNERTLEEFFAFFGVDPNARTISGFARTGQWTHPASRSRRAVRRDFVFTLRRATVRSRVQ